MNLDYGKDHVLPAIGGMILAAGVWCCMYATLNVLSRPCIVLCESLHLPVHCTSVAGLTASIAYTWDYLGHYLLQGFGAACAWC